jgi:murein peptide amidase A
MWCLDRDRQPSGLARLEGRPLALCVTLPNFAAVQRLGRNLGRYHGEGIDIVAVLGRIMAAAEAGGWTNEPFVRAGQADGADVSTMFALKRVRGAPRRRIYLSAGIHGDEPAGPLAVERLLAEDRWPGDVALTLCPCLNPTGFSMNSRENAAGIDLNRDYLRPVSPEVRRHVAWMESQPEFDVTLCLHEDWEAHGFYLYELNPDRRPSLAERMVAAAAESCPIDGSPEIDGRPTFAPGIIRPAIDLAARPVWPEAFYLLQHKTRQSYTLEAPSDWPLEVRIQVLVRAVRAALEAL